MSAAADLEMRLLLSELPSEADTRNRALSQHHIEAHLKRHGQNSGVHRLSVVGSPERPPGQKNGQDTEVSDEAGIRHETNEVRGLRRC